MTVSRASHRLIRPEFLKWSIAAFVLLTPFVARAIWDYVETRRLRTRIEAIERRGEPLGTALYVRLSPAAADADRFYRAAAALASGFELAASPPQRYQLTSAILDGNWTPDLRKDVRARLERYGDALALADRAAEQPFEGFDHGFNTGLTYSYVTRGLWSVARMCALRAALRALDGDDDGAYDSLYSAFRTQRALEQPLALPAVKLVIEHARPSPAARARVARALAEINVDDLLKQGFMRSRSLLLNGHEREINTTPWVVRPWAVHRLTSRLDVFASLVAAAGKPEPDRVPAVLAVGRFPAALDLPREQGRASLEGFTKGFVAQAEWVRCARRLVSGEVVDCHF